MSGWFNWDPEVPDPSEEEKKGKKHELPNIGVEVVCGGCMKPINIRMEKKDGLKKTKQCRNCFQLIEVHRGMGGQVRVYQSGQRGENRHETGYERLWDE